MTTPRQHAELAAQQSVTGALPERDTTKTAEQQGLFRKFDVRRVDGSDQLGGKHHGCLYYVLDVDHDPYAAAALGAYADACKESHPELARDLREKWGAADTIDTLRAQLAEQEDMAAVGRALMEAVKTYAPKHWHPNDCPSEIVGDLANECDELRVRLANAKEDREITYLTGVAVGKKGCEEQLAEAQRDSERLDWMIEQCAYVVSDPDCCDGYWLNYLRPDGTMWTQATEHETPRAAIDAAMGETL